MWCPAPTLAERTHPRMRKRVQDKVVVWQAFVALVGRGGGENSHVCCEVLLTLYADKALPCVSVCVAACMMAHRFVEVALLALNELIEHSTGGAGSKGAPNATGRGGASQGGQGGVDAATLERFEEHVERLVRVACGCVVREPALLVDDKHRACVGATHGSKRCFFFFCQALCMVFPALFLVLAAGPHAAGSREPSIAQRCRRDGTGSVLWRCCAHVA